MIPRAILVTVTMMILSPVVAVEVDSFTLINADTDLPVASHDPLVDGAEIDLVTAGQALNIRANVSGGTPEKINFTMSGAESASKSEGTAPYALFGDSAGDYKPWLPSLGAYSLTADADGAGSKTISFTVISSGNPDDGDGSGAVNGDGSVAVNGTKRRWHTITLDLAGPWASETGSPNPFLDYRMTVTFTHAASGDSLVVPGYFAADGNAANSGATHGAVWRAHLAPHATGTWNYSIDFRSGANCAVNGGGSELAPFDGASGSFSVNETNKSGRDLRAHGLLEYVGGHYLRFAGTQKYFLKQGPDAPENLLAYEDFDGPFATDGQKDKFVKDWAPHVGDWTSGDPTWAGGKGKGLIGAINYLKSEGLNAFSFLTMNIGGDDRNVFPYLDYDERRRLDCSRLDQWGIVFQHGTHNGFFLHFKTQETENELLLNNGDLGVERKLYYRELIARFAHNLALNWNLGEETNNATSEQKKAWAQYFYDNDPYHHHIVIHNANDKHYDLLGPASELTGFSLQTNLQDFSLVHDLVKDYVQRSADAGKPWAVACDEPGDAQHALRPDKDAGNSHEDGRKNGLWGTFLAGGWGNEWYFGYGHAHSDLTCNDFRSRDAWWDYCRHALAFFNDNDVPFWSMMNDNDKSTATNDYCFYDEDVAYVVYLKDGGTSSLDLTAASGNFTIQWFDPRNGGALQNGSKATVSGGGVRKLGNAPNNTDKDWVILVSKDGVALDARTIDLTLPTAGTHAVSISPAPGGSSNDTTTFTFTGLDVAIDHVLNISPAGGG